MLSILRDAVFSVIRMGYCRNVFYIQSEHAVSLPQSVLCIVRHSSVTGIANCVDWATAADGAVFCTHRLIKLYRTSQLQHTLKYAQKTAVREYSTPTGSDDQRLCVVGQVII